MQLDRSYCSPGGLFLSWSNHCFVLIQLSEYKIIQVKLEPQDRSLASLATFCSLPTDDTVVKSVYVCQCDLDYLTLRVCVCV